MFLGPEMAHQRKLSDLRPVLVHAHFAPDACNALLLARKLQIPLVASLHGYDITAKDELQSSLYLWRREKLKVQASRFLCVSTFIRNQALAKGFPSEKTVVHYTGIDLDLFRSDACVARAPVVLFVGRLVPVKGCEYLIRAMADIQHFVPDAKLVVIGDGHLRDKLERQAAQSLNNYSFLGAQPPALVRKWMNQATVFCTPSVTAESGQREAFGMVFLEAQAMGLPVVSFASGGIPEAVANGQTGFLVPEGDWRALGEKILLFLRDGHLWNKFSKAGESRVRRQFDNRKQAKVLEVIYEHVIDEYRTAQIPLNPRACEMALWSTPHDL